MTYHKVWAYLADDFDLKIFPLQIEEKSGIPPTAKYQHELIKKAKEAKVTHVVAAGYYRGYAKLITKITSDISGKSIFIDIDCLDNEDYLAMMDRIINTLLKFK
jgi:ABC-type Zn uptake system ZnuABC Zn-binding protein ZnuA